MGIQGLLPFVDSIGEDAHLSRFRGQRVAIDGYFWLHKAAKCCPLEMARGMVTDKYVNYCLRQLDMLTSNGLIPTMVFDGAALPAKRGTEVARRAERERNRMEADALLKQGERQRALEAYHKSVDVKPEHAYELVRALRRRGVNYVIAPYEADAQLAFLARHRHVDLVLTEDSDLLAFGSPAVLYKLDGATQTGRLLRRDALQHARAEPARGAQRGALLFEPWEEWDQNLFLDMCILAGCDYLPSLPGLGLRSAHKALKGMHAPSAENVVRIRQMEARGAPPGGFEAYMEALGRARETFLHQRVYDPTQQQVIPLTPLPLGAGGVPVVLSHCGEDLDPDLARALCGAGDVHPQTHEPFRRIGGGSKAAGDAASARIAKGASAVGDAAGGGVGLLPQRGEIQPTVQAFLKHSTSTRKPFRAPRPAGAVGTTDVMPRTLPPPVGAPAPQVGATRPVAATSCTRAVFASARTRGTPASLDPPRAKSIFFAATDAHEPTATAATAATAAAAVNRELSYVGRETVVGGIHRKRSVLAAAADAAASAGQLQAVAWSNAMANGNKNGNGSSINASCRKSGSLWEQVDNFVRWETVPSPPPAPTPLPNKGREGLSKALDIAVVDGRQVLSEFAYLPTLKGASGSASAAGCAAMPPHTSDLRASSDSKSQRLSREGMQAMYKSAPSSLQAMTPSTVENQPLQDASPVVGKPTIAAEAGFSFADFACDVSPRR
tara:strand:- start:690 stop:2858 length:2169 start_codon:yes stop_codon:yes gene_type:complete